MLVQRLKYLDEQYVNVNLHDDDFFYAEHCDQDFKEINPCCGVCIMIILIQWAQLLAVRISLLLNTTLHLGMQ